jgi:hypothetical protein
VRFLIKAAKSIRAAAGDKDKKRHTPKRSSSNDKTNVIRRHFVSFRRAHFAHQFQYATSISASL